MASAAFGTEALILDEQGQVEGRFLVFWGTSWITHDIGPSAATTQLQKTALKN